MPLFRRSAEAAVWLALPLCVLLSWAPLLEARTCLADAVPADDRRTVIGELGKATKLKIWGLSWASADIVGSIASIIVSEVLGYDVDYAARGDSSASAIYALAGCASPATFQTDPGCNGTQGERYHVSMELWDTSIVGRAEAFADDPSRLPVRVGELGYLGVETMYVFDDIRRRAYSAKGLPLEYYLSYDLTWRNPVAFFDSIDSIPKEKLKRCNETTLVEAEELAVYEAVTRDSGGLELGPSGRVQGRCWRDSWWFAPTCRDEPSKCVPLITGGSGWFLFSFMQAATKYRMPLALATAADWQTYLELPYQHDILMYWWTPDSAFVDEAPVPITFPEFDQELWKAGEKSVASKVAPSKWASANLREMAGDVYEFVEAFAMDNDEINALLSSWKVGGDSWEVACAWVNRSTTWQQWVPTLTACRSGFGLVDSDGRYTAGLDGAQACAPCDIGYVSRALASGGLTFICVPCPVGTSQLRYGDQFCSVCAPGTYSDTEGQSRCTQCSLGSYTSAIGATSCRRCPGALTTATVGSVEVYDCVCPADSFARSNSSTVCDPCPPGLQCATGSSALNIPPCDALDAGLVAQGQWPKPQRGHFASCREPLSAYRCLSPSACPGGALDACSGGYVGHLCARCEDGLYDAGSDCRRCADLPVSIKMVPLIILVLAPLLVYVFHVMVARAADQMTERLHGTPLDFGTSIAFIMLLFFQVTATGFRIIGGAAAVSPTIGRMLELSVRVDEVLSSPCLVTLSFEAAFVLHVTVPLHAVLLFVLCYGFGLLFSSLPGARGVDLNVATNNLCNVLMALAVTHLEAALDVFRCYPHPNGRYSLLSAPQASCYDDRWRWLAAISVVLVVGFYAPMLAGLAHVIRQTHRQKHVAAFRTRWRFILIRFRSPHVWFVFAVLARALCVSLATIITTDPLQQFVWLFVSCTAYLIILAVVQPWKRYTLNIIDLWMSSASLVALVVTFSISLATEGTDASRRRLEVALISPIIGAVLLALVLSLDAKQMPDDRVLEELRRMFELLGDEATLQSVLRSLCSTDLAVAKAAGQALREDLRMRLEFANHFHESASSRCDLALCIRAAREWCQRQRGNRVTAIAETAALSSVAPQPVGSGVHP